MAQSGSSTMSASQSRQLFYGWGRLCLLVTCLGSLCSASSCATSLSLPLACDDPTQQIGVVFPGMQIPMPGGMPRTLFANGPEFGCVGVTWPGQTTEIPNFVARYTMTPGGVKVALRDQSGNFVETPIQATISAGVDSYNVYFYISRGAPQSINCESYLQGGLSRCFGDDNCLLVTRVEGVAAGGQVGTCRLCSREVCNNRDDDCNGQVDDNGACGRVSGGCRSLRGRGASAPGCPLQWPPGFRPPASRFLGEVCGVDSVGDVFFCAGSIAEPQVLRWRRVSDVNASCNAGTQSQVISVGVVSAEFLCEECQGSGFTFWGKDWSRCEVKLSP